MSSHNSKSFKQQLKYLLPKDTLSEDVWESDGVLRLEIRDALLRIAREFFDFLDVEATIVDIIFTGSLANYNYTKFSDIDLHLLLDFSQVDDNLDLVKDFMMAKKSLWNDRHDIKIKGHEVEMFPQDENVTGKLRASGVYSIVDDDWVVRPSRSEADVSLSAVREKAKSLMSQIDKILERPVDLERFDRIKAKIINMRKSGLERSGEFSTENLAFKVLRRNGYLEKLYDISRKEYDKSLSLNQESLVRDYIRSLILS